MTRLIIFLISCALGSLVFPQSQPANLLKNPGFDQVDDKGQPVGWSFGDYKTGGTPLHERTAGRNGSGALGTRCATTEQRGAWQQSLPVGPGYLQVSGWYRTEGVAAGTQGATVRLTYLKGEKGWDYLSDYNYRLPPAQQWTAFERVFVVPAQTGHVAVELFNFFTPGTVLWDDVVAKVPTDEEINRMMAQMLDQPAAEDQISYATEDGTTVSVNPPAFIWVPATGVKQYLVQYSQDASFKQNAVTVRDIDLSVYTPTETIKPGRWYWRYGFEGANAKPVFSKTRSFTIPADAIAYPRPPVETWLQKIPQVRPRIYFTPEKVAEIRADADGKYKNMVRGIVSNADRHLGQPLYPEPDWLPKDPQEHGKAYLLSFQTMRPWTAGMEACALAYVCTGDRKYADEAKRRLLHFATWKVDGPTNVYHNDEAHMDIIMRGPRTYDWIYDALKPEERQTIEAFLRARLVQTNEMHRKMPFESKPYGSHQGRMIGFMVEGMIVFGHELPEAKEWLDYYSRLLWSVYPVWGSDDGGWHEGIGYWSAYMSMMTMVVEELDRLGIPWKNKPYLQNTGYFGLYCAYPKRKASAFGDGHENGVGAGQGQLLYALSSIYDNPYFRWYAEQTGGGPGGGAMAFNIAKPELKAKPPTDLPQARNFPHVGWVAMHSNMAKPEDNLLFLLHSSPYGATSHNHANQNAFVLEAYTEPLAISSGYYHRYGNPHHAQWVWETKAHNSILVDNKGQVTRSFASKGFITEFENTDDFCYTTGDATRAYGGRLKKFLRHVLFVRPSASRVADTISSTRSAGVSPASPGYFVIYDELEAAQPSTYQWLLHARSEMKLDPANLALTSEQGGSRLRVQFLTPDKLEFTQTDQFPVQPEKEVPNQWHFQASTTAPAQTMRFVTVLIPYRTGEESNLPQCKLLANENGVALQVGDDLIAWKDAGAPKVSAGSFSSAADVTALVGGAKGQPSAVFVRGQGAVSAAGIKVRK
ncbi:MAG: DUF4962 domain-containing protein [Armatimonadia bacterium]